MLRYDMSGAMIGADRNIQPLRQIMVWKIAES
jgi:hypothetical protein